MAGYRPQYTIDEERKIIKYIVENNEFTRLKGDRLWKDMEETGELKPRTWQSLKQHFRKKLIYKMHYPELGIDKDIQKKIYQYYHCQPLSITIRHTDSNDTNDNTSNERRSVSTFSLTSSTSSSSSDED